MGITLSLFRTRKDKARQIITQSRFDELMDMHEAISFKNRIHVYTSKVSDFDDIFVLEVDKLHKKFLNMLNKSLRLNYDLFYSDFDQVHPIVNLIIGCHFSYKDSGSDYCVRYSSTSEVKSILSELNNSLNSFYFDEKEFDEVVKSNLGSFLEKAKENDDYVFYLFM